MPRRLARLRCVTRESASTASSSFKSRCASMSMDVLRGWSGKVVPRDEPGFRDRAPGGASDNVAELARGNAGAGALRPDVVGADRGAGGDVAHRHDAVVRHV